MKKLLFLLPCLILIGAGCGSSDTYDNDYNDSSYYYDDPYYEDSYDYESDYGSYDAYAGIPQGYQDVYACDLDGGYCDYIEVNISGNEVSSAYYGGYTYPSESYCDTVGCYYVDYLRHEWYFDF
ncbi:hypothetical protein HN358_01095 [Candidatus Uhrbacteria bacterium]|jgi:hypothetical protein|nr:hypothetical protein [Candidatus Uhrbacteria bacterium]MBT7717372.1 hypothetical protein [Candidatus Uhrbacteria bacterium]